MICVLPSHISLGPRLYGETLSRVERLLAYPSYPGRANFHYISLKNLANRLHEKQKVGSAGRVTRLAGSPFFDGRVTLLAGPTFLHTLARPAGSTPSRRDNQSMRERSWLGQRGNLVPRTRATLIQRNGKREFPVPLDKGNAGSGNEIGKGVNFFLI